MEAPIADFVRAASLDELKAKGWLVVHGSVEDGILTCHWHRARFDLASGCTFDLWADDVPTCPVEIRTGEVWVKPVLGGIGVTH